MAASDYTALVQQFYIGFYGRPADKEGLDFWAGKVDENGGDFSEVLDAFATSDEAQEFVYNDAEGNPYTNTELVTNIYSVLLERDPDTEGLDFYVAGLEDGTFTLQSVVKNIIDGAEEGSTDRAVIDNKVTVAEDFTSSLKDNTVYDNTNIDDARAVIADVDATDESVTDAEAKADSFVADNTPSDPGEDFTLTTGVDALIGTDGDNVFTGNAATNTISGALQDTFQSVDSINGGEGTDTVKAQIGSAGAVTVGPNIAAVEKFEVTSFNNSTFNMANVDSAATHMTIQSSVGTTTVTNAKNILDLTVKSQASDVEVVTNSTAVAGVSDSMNITLSGANGGTSQDVMLGSNAAGGIVETLNLTSTGSANNVTLGGTVAATSDVTVSTTTLNIDGDQDLTLDLSANTGLTKLDANTATGNLTLDLTNVTAANKLAITSGAGDDTISTNQINKDMVIDGGDGDDTLRIVALASSLTTGPTISNVEDIVFAGSGAVTVNLAKVTGATELTVTDDATATDLTVTKVASELDTVNFLANGLTTVEANALDGLVYTLADATGKTDVLNVNVANVNAAGVHVTKDDGVITTINNLQANGIETINLDVADMGAKTTTPAANGGVAFTAFTATSLQTLDIDSSTYVDISGATLSSTVNTVDASEATSGVSLDLSAAADSANTVTADKAVIVTGGAGDDTFASVLGAVKTTINAGDGKDSITLSGAKLVGKLTVDAGAGDDTIDLSADVAAGAGGAVAKAITTGAGSDTVTVFSAATIANAQSGTVIADFTVGSAGDKLDFSTNQSDVVAKVTYVEKTVNAGDAGYTLANGFTALKTDSAPTALDTTTIATWLSDIDAAGVATTAIDATTSKIMYFAVSDGTDTGIYQVVNDATAAVTAAEMNLMVTLTGVTDATTLNADNLADFL